MAETSSPTHAASQTATHTSASAPARPSSFDAHHPPQKEHIDDCVHCGFCLPACPTYVLWGEEMDSPRGRIYMIKKAADGEAPLDERFRLHMDNCLGCMACMTACPSGVEYNKLIEPTRAQIERNTSAPARPTACSANSSSRHFRILTGCACSLVPCASTSAVVCALWCARSAF